MEYSSDDSKNRVASRFRLTTDSNLLWQYDLIISPKPIILKQEEAPNINQPENPGEMYCYNFWITESSKVVIHFIAYNMILQIGLTDKTSSSEGKTSLGNKTCMLINSKNISLLFLIILLI